MINVTSYIVRTLETADLALEIKTQSKNSCEWKVVSTKFKSMNERSDSLPQNMLSISPCLILKNGKMDKREL